MRKNETANHDGLVHDGLVHDGFVKSPYSVIPAKAGIQKQLILMDRRVRHSGPRSGTGDDGNKKSTFYEGINHNGHNGFSREQTVDVSGRTGPAGQQGSVIVLALLILSILTLGGIIAMNRSWVESRVVANSAIHKQNLALVDSVVMDGISELLNPRDYIEGLDHEEGLNWFYNKNNVPNLDTFSSVDNLDVLAAILDPDDGLDILDQRGEVERDSDGNVVGFNNASLRFYGWGWYHIGGTQNIGESIVDRVGGVRRRGAMVGIYESNSFGRKAIEIGLVMLREVN